MQNNEEDRYKTKNILISHYTVNVTGIVLSFNNIHKEVNNIIKHFKQVLAIENPNDSNDLIKFTKNSEYYKMYYADSEENIENDYIKDIFIYDINYPILTDTKSTQVLNYMNLNMKKKNLLKMMSFSGEKASIKNTKELEKLEIEIVKTQDRIKNADKEELENIKNVIITFKNQKLANFYHNLYKKNKCDRCCYIFCCQFNKIKHL